MLTYTSFDSFAEVEAHYNKTKPLGGHQNKGKDIRPIGDRRRKHERIVKISPNCYALTEGYHFGDEVTGAWAYGSDDYKPTLKDMERYAPIVWRKRKDGTDAVTIRNGWGPHMHTSRYQFLYRHSPKSMWFRNRNGKHFIETSTGLHYLAKIRTTPRAVYDAITSNPGQHYWQKRLKDFVRLQDDNASLTFTKNSYGRWTLESGGKEAPQPPRQIVNKSQKDKYKDAISQFRDWLFAVGPMLETGDYRERRVLLGQIEEYARANGYKTGYSWQFRSAFSDEKLARAIVKDAEHPLRVHFATAFIEYADSFKYVETGEDVARIKRQYNTWINKVLGFKKTVKG